MQHLDFTLVYSPGKNNPADFMSRNPSDTESSYLDKVTDELEESIIKMVKNKERAGVSNSLKDATQKDKIMNFSQGKNPTGRLEKAQEEFFDQPVLLSERQS